MLKSIEMKSARSTRRVSGEFDGISVLCGSNSSWPWKKKHPKLPNGTSRNQNFAKLLTHVPSRLGLYNTLTAHLQRRTPPNECLVYDTTQSDGEVPVMLELWGMRSTPLLPSLPGPLWPRVVVPDRVLSISQIELNCVLMLNWIVWNTNVFTFIRL